MIATPQAIAVAGAQRVCVTVAAEQRRRSAHAAIRITIQEKHLSLV
jgi:hypothetical protein